MSEKPKWEKKKRDTYGGYHRFCVPGERSDTAVFINYVPGDGWYMDSGFDLRDWHWEKINVKGIKEAKVLAETMWRMQ